MQYYIDELRRTARMLKRGERLSSQDFELNELDPCDDDVEIDGHHYTRSNEDA